jgi:hypothetical protein
MKEIGGLKLPDFKTSDKTEIVKKKYGFDKSYREIGQPNKIERVQKYIHLNMVNDF